MTRVPGGDGLLDGIAQAVTATSGPVYVGFSGGLDSTVLLHAAGAVLAPPNDRKRLRALHINHGLHPDADTWEQRCAAAAGKLGIEFVAHRVSVARPGSLEARARAARYVAFAACLDAPDSRLLLAHHRDDQAETVMLRLLQGRGLYGMPAERRLGSGRLLRPLLDQPRSQLLAYAHGAGLEWIEDPANADPALDRNFVRRRILPELRARFPGVDLALVRAMSARAVDERQLGAALGLDLTATSLPVDVLLARGAEEQRIVLRLWLASHGRSIPAARALDEFAVQLRAGSDRQPCLQLDQGALRRHRGQVWLCGPPPELAHSYAIATPGELVLPHGRLAIASAPSGFTCRGAVTVRFRTGGECIRTRSGTRPVKSVLQDAGVKPWLRGFWPLVCDADGLAAVPGLAVRHRETGDERPVFCARWLPDDPADHADRFPLTRGSA